MKSAVRMDSIQINRMTVSTYFTVRVEGSGGEEGNRALERTAWGQLAAALVPRSVSAYQCVTRNVKEFCGEDTIHSDQIWCEAQHRLRSLCACSILLTTRKGYVALEHRLIHEPRL